MRPMQCPPGSIGRITVMFTRSGAAFIRINDINFFLKEPSNFVLGFRAPNKGHS